MSRRQDSLGFFWEDMPRSSSKSSGPRQWGPMPRIPETGWKAPKDFPNLTGAKVIGIDTETYDPELTTSGPGWGRGLGHIVGASLAVEDGTSWYFPIRHESCVEENMDPDNVLRYLKYTLSGTQPKVGANLIYDIGWFLEEGIKVGGKLYDIQFAEALLNSETPDVSLNSLAKQYLGVGKETEFLYEWLASWNSKPVNDKQRKWIYKAPPSLVGPYAEGDASLPIKILLAQWPLMAKRGVLDLFSLECRLIPLLVEMRRKGAPINLSKAEETYERLGLELVTIEQKLKSIAGQPVNPNAAESQKSAFKRVGLEIPTTIDKTKGTSKITFAAPVLETIDHPLVASILEYRRIEKVRNVFVKSYIMDKNINGRIHCSFHPLKGDSGGARSGRFASSDPNLQNIPIRTEIGKLVRQMFESRIRWRSFDYASIEYRMLVHFAVGPGSDEVRMLFTKNPTADYHKIVGDLIERITSIILERGSIKTINFGIIYGMALNALAAALNLPRNEASKLLKSYHEAIPYARTTMDECAKEVHKFGYVTTILGRRSDFPYWGPKSFEERTTRGFDYQYAARKWGMYNIERQHTHKALNRKLQGSAADIMKKAMVTAYENGLFADDACGMPILTVHDELDFDDENDLDNPAWDELKRVMETSTQGLRVPLIVDGGFGKTWGDAH